MEKYIFHSNHNLNSSPKFLTRNYRISKHTPLSQNAPSYLNNKIFITNDYSYYQHLQNQTQTQANQLGSPRVNNLSTLFDEVIDIRKSQREN